MFHQAVSPVPVPQQGASPGPQLLLSGAAFSLTALLSLIGALLFSNKVLLVRLFNLLRIPAVLAPDFPLQPPEFLDYRRTGVCHCVQLPFRSFVAFASLRFSLVKLCFFICFKPCSKIDCWGFVCFLRPGVF